MKLGLGKCRLSVQAPVGQVTDVRSLAGKRIVTSFPNLTRSYFSPMDADQPTQIKCISGSVEGALRSAKKKINLRVTFPTLTRT